MVWPFTSSEHQLSISSHINKRDLSLYKPLSPGSDKEVARLKLESISIDQLDPLEREIIQSDITDIVQGIKSKRWTSTNVLHAFFKNARKAHRRINCLTEIAFETASIKAADLDRHFAETGELVGPLHGVPISFKELFHIKGTQMTLGFSSWLSRPISDKSSSMVMLMEHLGGVPFVKTNVPQTMLAFECNNPLYGRTLNPYSPDHTCGGSSGGEAALLACDGSPLGLGSDIGGSLRIPVGYCGVYSIKPSVGRFPKANGADFAKGFEGVKVVEGPICRSAKDLELIYTKMVETFQIPKVAEEKEGSDEAVELELKYESLMDKLGAEGNQFQSLRPAWLDPLRVAKVRGRPLRIGYYYTDGFIKTTPACYRAVDEAVESLRSKYSDKEVKLVKIPVSLLGALESLTLFTGMTSSDGYDMLTDPHLGKDKADPTLFLPLLLARMSKLTRSVLAFVASFLLRDWMLALTIKAMGRKSTKDYQKLVAKRDEFREKWHERVWKNLDLDGIIAPVQASPAVPHKGATNLSMLCSSTVLYNILDCAVTICPVTRVDRSLDYFKEKDDIESKSEEGRKRYRTWKEDKEQNACSHLVNFELYTKGVYDAVKMDGLPVGVQVVTKPYEEEKAIGLLKLLDQALPEKEERGKEWKDLKSGKVVKGLGLGVYSLGMD
ncbi:amidase signature enzyme [Violaceomyces palustris]|uniref:Amidase signature enzyme n=1 Tax=Violaceomyces palustris TaxID=1673888 RepID=A0ACD0P1J5_9BASI|nr:amidase signature enzyme [Violaceomyces palustris]